MTEGPSITHHMTIDGLELISVADFGGERTLRSSVTWETRELAAEFAPAAQASFEARAKTVDPNGSSTMQARRVRTPFGPFGFLTVRGSDHLTRPEFRRVARGAGLAWRSRVLVVSKL